MPDIARASLAVAILSAAALGASCARPPVPACGCMTLDAAVRGVEGVSARDWQQTDRRALQAEWPEAVPCDTGAVTGPEGTAAAIAHCCEACEVCGAAAGHADSPEAGLRAVELWVCPRPWDRQQAALRTLARAAGAAPERTSVNRTDDRVIEGYTWTRADASFMLMTNAIETEGAWLGHFLLGRCPAREAVESWRVDDGPVVSVTRADVERGENGHAALSFEYVSACLVHDGGCRDRELDRLWPALRARAEQEKASAIHIATEDCTARNIAFRLDRAADGRWSGGPWTPRGR